MAHPRKGGDHHHTEDPLSEGLGSPPHGRGPRHDGPFVLVCPIALKVRFDALGFLGFRCGLRRCVCVSLGFSFHSAGMQSAEGDVFYSDVGVSLTDVVVPEDQVINAC